MISKAVTLGMNILIMLSLAACGLVPALAPAPTPAPIIVTQLVVATDLPATATPPATNTPLPTSTSTPRPSPTPNLKATEEYNKLQAQLGTFFDAGYIGTKQWSIDKLDSYSDDWAQLNYYAWSMVDQSPSADFIIRSDVSWESASQTPDDSGCGFVFREQPNKDHYMVYIAMDGHVHAAHNISNQYKEMGYGYYGKGSLSGSHNITLLVKGSTFTVLVDDKLVKVYTGFKDKLTAGNLAYTVLSGTNQGFGTRCHFENTVLWTDPVY